MTPQTTAQFAPITEPALFPGAALLQQVQRLDDECVRERQRGWLYHVFCGLVELGLTEEETGHVLAEVLAPRNAPKKEVG